MYLNNRIGVVVPAYNEQRQIFRTIIDLPEFVDQVIVIDDGSTDDMIEVLTELKKTRENLLIIQHSKNRGVGAAIQTGYEACLKLGINFAIVIGGDGQMDPKYFSTLIEKIVHSNKDYVKVYRQDLKFGISKIPTIRVFGQTVLTLMTNLATGLWEIRDSQAGYTIANKKCMEVLTSNGIFEGYGVPNDILIKCSLFNLRVGEVFTPPIYGVGEVSRLKPLKVILPILKLLVRGFLYRVFIKNTIYQPSIIPALYTLLTLTMALNAFVLQKLFFDVGLQNLSRVELMIFIIYVIANLLILFTTIIIDKFITSTQNSGD